MCVKCRGQAQMVITGLPSAGGASCHRDDHRRGPHSGAAACGPGPGPTLQAGRHRYQGGGPILAARRLHTRSRRNTSHHDCSPGKLNRMVVHAELADVGFAGRGIPLSAASMRRTHSKTSGPARAASSATCRPVARMCAWTATSTRTTWCGHLAAGCQHASAFDASDRPVACVHMQLAWPAG